MDLLSLREHYARTLLIHYRWDVAKVFEVYGNEGKDCLYKDACVMVHDDGDISSMPSTSAILCEICMEEVPFYKTTTMDCGHCFCNDCWREHFVVKINEGQGRRISCMAYKCDVICDEDKIRNSIRELDPALAKKFDQYLLESYIEDNKRVKWCPSVPHCGNAIRIENDDELCEVECVCGVQFCFSCSSEAHSPCSCEMWELWTMKNKDESETVNWLIANTRNCPKCLKPAEKNGGCNLVRCICKQAYCWKCGGATGTRHTWDSIEGHTCGRFMEDYLANKEHRRAKHWRYMHYYNHYKAHTDSLAAELSLKGKLQEKISKLTTAQPEIKDYTWVTNGANRLFRSRRLLSYSYPFAYYMFNDTFLSKEMTEENRTIKRNLFEDKQQQLEGNIEKLSHFLEKLFDEDSKDEVMESRQKIVTLSKITNVLCKNLYDCIDNDILLHLTTIINIAPYKSKGLDKAVELRQ
uniref:probable E3 ubiquitin-protein ligase ARI1 n=1 Tax=Erigeron canadensis TaxID=72917 RepID=UPI001CB9C2A3|nr:probable E3 ubiquitin-protein ligase ARI1 [Erigeron canadensis]